MQTQLLTNQSSLMAAAGAAKKIFDKIPDNVDKQIQNQAKQAHRDRGTALKIANSIGYLLDQKDLGNQKQANLFFQIESLKATKRDIFIIFSYLFCRRTTVETPSL